MSHRHLSGRMACGLSKWDTEEANRLFIHVLIWWLFLSLLSHFHFKCQRTSFGLCQNAPRGDRKEVATALVARDGSFRGSKFSLSFSCKFTSWICTKLRKEKEFIFLILSSIWDYWEWIRALAVSGGGRSCVMADVCGPGKKEKEKDSENCFICLGVGWCKQTQSLCKLLILWTMKSSW